MIVLVKSTSVTLLEQGRRPLLLGTKLILWKFPMIHSLSEDTDRSGIRIEEIRPQNAFQTIYSYAQSRKDSFVNSLQYGTVLHTRILGSIRQITRRKLLYGGFNSCGQLFRPYDLTETDAFLIVRHLNRRLHWTSVKHLIRGGTETNQRLKQTIDLQQPTNQSINQSISHSITHSLTHSLNQSINQSNEWTNSMDWIRFGVFKTLRTFALFPRNNFADVCHAWHNYNENSY